MTRGTRKRRKREYECESRGEGEGERVGSGRMRGVLHDAEKSGKSGARKGRKRSARVVSVCETRRKG